jgi:hypothetical protein
VKKLNLLLFFIAFFLSCNFLSAIYVSLVSPENNTAVYTTASNFNCIASDDINLVNTSLRIDGSLNQTNSSGFNDTTYTFSVSLADGNHTWTCESCDDESQCSTASARIVMVDSSGPTASANSTNSTYAGQAVMHRVYFQDSNFLSEYIFSFDNCTGSFANDSWQSFSSASAGGWSNVTKYVSSGGCTVRWKVYANDSYNKLGVSSEYSYVPQDSGYPVVSLNSPANNGNLSSVTVTFNCSVTDSAISNVTLYGNWSGWHSNETKSLTGSSNSTTFSKTISANAFYSWNCYSCDTSNNCNFSSSNKTFLIDTIKPIIYLISPSNDSEISNTSQIFRINVTDNFNIKNCSLYVDDDLEDTEDDIDNASAFSFSSLSLDGSSSGVSYNWYVNCSDFAGNLNKSAVWRLIIQTDDSTSETSSDSASTTAYWTTTYAPDSSDFSNETGYVKELALQSRVKVNISSSSHYVGVVGLTSTKATINISSTPQQAVFNIGDEKKFEVTGDDYYDLFVKLNGISNNKANTSIRTIHEKIPNLGSSSSSLNSSSSESGEQVRDSSLEEGTENVIGQKIWIVLVVIIVVLFGVLGYYLFKKEKEIKASSVTAPWKLQKPQ